MSAETFEWVVIDEPAQAASLPPSGRTGLPVTDMPALQATPAAELRALSFPAPDDPQDVYTLSTHLGSGEVDQGTGTLLAWQPATAWQRWSDTVEMLHTGQGAAVLGLLLGLAALGVPLMAVTGVIVWWAGRKGRGRPRLRDNAPAAQADNKAIAAPRMDHRVNGSAQMAATAPRGGVSNSALCGDGKSAPCGLA